MCREGILFTEGYRKMKSNAVSEIMLTLLLIGMLTLVFNVQPVKAEPRTWTVDDDGPADFSRIQDAIDASTPGDVINVKAGNYYEEIEIQKSLILIGEEINNTIISTNGFKVSWGLIEVRSTTNVTISGFTIKGHENGMGIFMSDSNDCNISHNLISSHQYGIDIRGSNNNFVGGNVISECSVYGIVLSEGSRNNILRNNSLANNDMNLGVFSFFNDIDNSNMVNGKAVYYWVNQKGKQIPGDAGYVALINSTNIVVKNLKITHNQGVLLAYTTNSTIENVNVSKSLWGIHLDHSHNNLISGCTLTRNDYGIRMDDSNRNSITQNTVSHNWGDGIALYSSNENNIINNTITIDWRYGNSFGIADAFGNSIHHNNIVHRYDRGVFIPSSSPNEWNGVTEGNYWSDYNGTDIDGDGIGDIPYVIDADNIDRYPLMTLWIWAPDTVPPIADAGENQTVAANATECFDASNSQDNVEIIRYEWDFGDGVTGVGLRINHTYSTIGNYTVTLTVKDLKDNSNSTSIIIEVLTDTDKDEIADRFDNDDDNDGMPDEWEVENGLDPLDPSDADQDLDGDWFSNIEEYQWGMNPRIYNPWKINFSIAIATAIASIPLAIFIAFIFYRKKKATWHNARTQTLFPESRIQY